ncbi:MAG TPA: sigma-70 family RNA polymerase sigma factor [Vicinamibacterales bacterium]|nr:sigma-70 family RNA polymerase sigma factor [Vicinamibacterales bacterium]
MTSPAVRYNDAALKPESDFVLLERIAARDEAAVGELYDRHSRLLYGLILRILRDRGEAEEVLQEVFVSVWNRVATYNAGLGPPAAWLVGIARNRAIDRLRANSARSRAIASVRVEVESRENPERDASLGEEQRAIRHALDAIPPEQRDLIEEAYFLGLTHSELAERHKLPLGTVKTRIRTGLLALREQLSQIGVEQ